MVLPVLPIWSRSLCAAAGAMVGGFAGVVMGLLLSPPHAFTLTASETWKAGLLLGLVGWVILLIVFGLWLHYGMSQIAGPSLLNALLSAVLTVWVCRALHVPILDTLIGLLVGTLVGWILCQLCGRFTPLKGANR
jgi:uncharacterized membrane protein YeaQ/YmgE (transglycosylase-associated protein family)